MATVPKCVALMICEHVHQELNGNLSLISMFDQLRPSYFPWPLQFVVFALFTNAHDSFPVRIRLVHSRDAVGDINAPCLTHAAGIIDLTDKDPLASHSATVLMQAHFRESGDYIIEAFAAGECIASRKLRVFEPPSPGTGSVTSDE